MSNIYIKEPSTFGKVLLHTSMGDIDVELFSKEAPLACRNFVQLCMEEYYNNVVFHRIVPKFIVQGGDPTGTGEGGESIFGKPFKDEFHQRLRFVRRGLVAMANAGPDDNGSQFFFTLGPCNDLNKKHTIFGKVTGDTVYNLVRLGEVEVENDDQPINPPFIKWTKVLANPFDDIEPRVSKNKQKDAEQKKPKKSKMKATKDFKLLSFGEEAEEEEKDNTQFEQNRTIKSKSSHDLTNDPKLSSLPAVEIIEEEINLDETEVPKPKTVDMIKNKLQKSKVNDNSNKGDSESKKESKSKSDELKSESRRLAREIIQARKRKNEEPKEKDDEKESSDEEKSSNPMFDEYKNQQKKYKKIKNKSKGSDREKMTLALLEGFKTKMFDARKDAGWKSDEEDPEEEQEEEEGDDDAGWILHKLGNRNELRDAKDMNREVTEDRFDINDPRNPLNKRRRDKDSKSSKDKSSHEENDRKRQKQRR